MIGSMRNLVGKALVVAAVTALASPAFAGPTLVFNLDQISNSAIGTGTGSLGTVTLTQNSSAQVDVKVSINPFIFLNTGGPHTPFTFNTSFSSGLSVSFVTPPNGQFTTVGNNSGTLSFNSAGGDNTPYGTFKSAIDSSAGNGTTNGYQGLLDFTVTRAAGLDTTNFIANPGGYFFAADVSDGSANGGDTGAIASKGPATTPVPEPASLLLLGGALVGLGAVTRRRRAA